MFANLHVLCLCRDVLVFSKHPGRAQTLFLPEASEVSHDWSVETPPLREWKLSQPCESHQVSAEDARERGIERSQSRCGIRGFGTYRERGVLAR